MEKSLWVRLIRLNSSCHRFVWILFPFTRDDVNFVWMYVHKYTVSTWCYIISCDVAFFIFYSRFVPLTLRHIFFWGLVKTLSWSETWMVVKLCVKWEESERQGKAERQQGRALNYLFLHFNVLLKWNITRKLATSAKLFVGDVNSILHAMPYHRKLQV